jgi:hypothetical protein
MKSITEISIDEFEHTWKANCGSAFLMTQLCLSEMERKGWGRVVFCSSVAGFNGGVVGPHYAYVFSFLPRPFPPSHKEFSSIHNFSGNLLAKVKTLLILM